MDDDDIASESWRDYDDAVQEFEEPCGSCDECEQDLYPDDVYYLDDLRLCGQCYWAAEQFRKAKGESA